MTKETIWGREGRKNNPVCVRVGRGRIEMILKGPV